jgi:Putative adhesin
MAAWTITETDRLGIDEEVKRLDVSLIAGRLSVVGTDGPARLEVSRIGDTPVFVKIEGGLLSVSHPMPATWPGPLKPLWWWMHRGRRYATDVTIAVPYACPSVLRMSAGSVLASGVRADLQVDCVSGRVTLLGNDGRIRATVVSGPIEALGCSGDVNLEAVSGEIILADSATQRVHAKTISGSLTADLDNPREDSDIFLETISGEITIRVREDSDLTVHLSATHGRVTSAFPGLAPDGKSSRAGWGAALRGVIGAGTGKLNATAVSGNISLLGRPVDNEFGSDSAEQSGGHDR